MSEPSVGLDELVESSLTGVDRLAWHSPGERSSSSVGPARLVFGDRALILDARSDWSLNVDVTAASDPWLDRYQYTVDGGQWIARDATAEAPFSHLRGQRLLAVEIVENSMAEKVGVALQFESAVLTLKVFGGELITE